MEKEDNKILELHMKEIPVIINHKLLLEENIIFLYV